MATNKKAPKNLEPTHEYRYTRHLAFQYNKDFHLARVLSDGEVIQDWMPPTTPIDTRNCFELLPHRPVNSALLKERYEALKRRGNVPAFMAKWRPKLDTDDYEALLTDLRAVILWTEVQYHTELKGSDQMDPALIKLISTIQI